MRDKLVLSFLTASSLLLLGCSHAKNTTVHIIEPSYSYLASSDDIVLESDGRILATVTGQDFLIEP